MRLSVLLAVVFLGASTARAETPSTKLSRLAKGLRDPVSIGTLPDRSQRMFVAEKRGRIRILRGESFERDLLDIEEIVDPSINGALTSVTFPSNYDLTKQFFVSFLDKQHDTIIATFKAREGHPNDEDDLQVVLKVAHPSSTTHSSSLRFGPDGHLYAGIADVGEGTDRGANAQNPRSLLGKILRIDVSNPSSYSVPSSNPFAKQKNYAPEVWALGFQNPTSLSFHASTSKLYAIDAGQRYQELNLVEAGKNYGWNILEGTSCVKPPCASTPMTPPAYEQTSPPLRGGFAYRGKAFPTLVGQFLISESGSHEITVLKEVNGTWSKEKLLSTEKPIAALGETKDGEILVATVDGMLYSVSAG
jgi:glucose/arabinose dehydrogenase